MWEYLAILLLGFWLGVAIFLYISCYWLDEILDLPPLRNGSPSPSGASSARPSSGASSAHVQLKRLVARVVEEAAALPALARYAAEPTTPTIDSTTYEDLLATAILNKVIERYQHETGSGGRSSGIHSASASPTPSERSSPRSLHTHAGTTRDITPPLHEEDDVSDWEEGEATDEALEGSRRVPFPEFGGDIVHSGDNEEREFDDVSSSDLQATDGTWEENWLFQKKKIKTIQSVPVPMLVPNSNTDYRALIGDRDADDTTDLSDNASDAEEQEETEYKSDIKRVLDSKHVIGGKIKIDPVSDFEPDSLTIDAGADEFEKLVSDEYKNDNAVDDIINEINDNKDTTGGDTKSNTTDQIDGKLNNSNYEIGDSNDHDSIILMGIDEGPLRKAEFNLKEEIHRSLINGNALHYQHDDTNCEEFDDSIESMAVNNIESTNNTLSRHQREGEYEETVTVPVQRYADSLRRKHFDDAPYEVHYKSREQNNNEAEEDLIPGSIAYRERKKWLNYVEMPNNPYSPEAIQKRLSSKSTSSLFDMITSKTNDFEEIDHTAHKEQDEIENLHNGDHNEKNMTHKTISSAINPDVEINGRRSESPSSTVLKDVLAEEVPQYKRYGRDYYIREAKTSAGGRKKNSFSDTSSVTSSTNKCPSIDNLDGEFASPVSASSSLSDIEACALHQNIVRAVLSPRNASPNFAINPIFENPDRQNDADHGRATERYVDRKTNVRPQSNNVCNEGDGYVENEDIVRLKIPNKPEITEDLFETYTDVRRSNTLRSEDLCVRSKRRAALNYTFGGSLSFSIYNSNYKTLVGLLIQQINNIATNQQYTKFANQEQLESITTTSNNNKTQILIEYDDGNDQTLFSARPAIVDDETDKRFEEIIQSAYETDTAQLSMNDTEQEKIEEPIKSPVSVANSYISTSSLEDSIKIYNVQTGEVIKCRPEDNVSARYEAAGDSTENIDITDKTPPQETFEGSSHRDDSDEDAVIIEQNGTDKLEEDEAFVDNEIEEILAQLPKVKELAKKFVSMDNISEPVKVPQPQSYPLFTHPTISLFVKRRISKENILNDMNAEKPNKMFMHSLTARSISKQFRDELKLSMATPLKVPGGSKEIPEGEEVIKESSRPGSPLPEPGTIKTKLAFFESLKNKFNGK